MALSKDYSQRELARQLEKEFPDNWTRERIEAILKNPVFAGMNYIGRRHDAKHFVVSDGIAKQICTSPLPLIPLYKTLIPKKNTGETVAGEEKSGQTAFTFVEGINDAYITVAQYNYIQEKMFAGKPGVRGDNVYVFSGLIKCGHCGRLMSGSSRKDGVQYYQCRNAREKVNTECRSWVAYESELMPYITGRLTDELEGKVLEAMSVQTPTLDVDKSELEKKLVALEGKIVRQNRRIADEDNELLIDGYKSTLLELFAEKKVIQQQLEQKRSAANLDDWKASLEKFWQERKTILVKTGEVTVRNHWIGKQTVGVTHP